MSWFKPRTSQDIPYVNKDVIEREVKGNLDYLKTTADTTTTNVATNTTGIATNVTDIATNAADIAANAAKHDDCVMRDGTTVAYASPAGARVKDGVYRNTSGKIRFVNIFAYGPVAGDSMTIKVGVGTPPGITVASLVVDTVTATFGANMFFVVPPNYYYEAEETNATVTISVWVEWDIL